MPNDLLLPSADSRKSLHQCSEGLRRLLVETDDGTSATRLIAINPTLRQQAQEVLPALLADKAPADAPDVLKLLIRKAPQYAVQARSDGEWAALFESYLAALEGFSLYQIEDAFRRWDRGEDMKDPAMGQFYPACSQLVALANKAKRDVWMAAHRAQKALEDTQSAPKVAPDERAKIAAGLAELRDSFKLKEMPEAMKPKMTPQQVAERIQEQRRKPLDDVGVVL